MKPYSKSKHISLLKKIRELFKANPEKKTITIKSRCSDCKCEVIIKITPSPGGYGLQGGALFECSPDGYCRSLDYIVSKGRGIFRID